MIRQAGEKDRKTIIALQLASWRDTYADVLPAAYLEEQLAADIADRWSTRPFSGSVLTLMSDQPGGFVCCLLDRDPPYIDNLHVSPEARGKGIGRNLMEMLFQQLHAQGHREAALTVLLQNHRARAFYRRLGGIEGPARPTNLFGNPVVEVPVRFTL